MALVYAGPATYTDIATHEGFARTAFVRSDGQRDLLELRDLLGIHNAWVRYITGRGPGPGGTVATLYFTPDERAHMADVRQVFIGAELAALVGLCAVSVLLARAAKRSRAAFLALARDGATAAGTGTLAVAIAAAVAFDPLFLLFHEAFFPQGNFLFGPDSNLLALYPDQYWYGVTLRVGLTFVAATAATALAATATLRRTRR